MNTGTRAIFIVVIMVMFVLMASATRDANAADRRPSKSETVHAMNIALDKLVPYSENVKRSRITIAYDGGKNYYIYSGVVCTPETKTADLVYDEGLVFTWQSFGYSGVASVMAHELAHCSDRNISLPHKNYAKEWHADTLGFDYFVAAGYNPQRYLDAYYARNAKGTKQHGSDRARINNIKKHAKTKHGIILK